MFPSHRHLAVVAVALAAAGCTPEGIPRQLGGDIARSGEARGHSAEQTAAAGEPDESHLRETAEQYVARHGDPKPFRSGEIEPSAVGPVASCITCHGPRGEGVPALGTPRIGGMPAWYLARELKYFQQGVRAATVDDVQGTQMRGVVLASMTDPKGLEGLAGYFATLHPPPAPAIESGDTAHGEQLFATCVACHGADGRGSQPLNTPSLVEQDGEYLVRQIEHFRTGVRGADTRDIFGQQMRAIASSVLTSRQDAVDVVAYVATLRD